MYVGDLVTKPMKRGEIAKARGIKEKTVSEHLDRAKRKLRTALASYYEAYLLET
jgi:predicted DNA binding protein